MIVKWWNKHGSKKDGKGVRIQKKKKVRMTNEKASGKKKGKK